MEMQGAVFLYNRKDLVALKYESKVFPMKKHDAHSQKRNMLLRGRARCAKWPCSSRLRGRGAEVGLPTLFYESYEQGFS